MHEDRKRQLELELGRSILDRAFSAEGYECTDKALEGVLKNFKQASVDDLCAQVGAGNFTARAVVEAVLEDIGAGDTPVIMAPKKSAQLIPSVTTGRWPRRKSMPSLISRTKRATAVSAARARYVATLSTIIRVKVGLERSWPTRPAACHVVPHDSARRSSSTTSRHPRRVR